MWQIVFSTIIFKIIHHLGIWSVSYNSQTLVLAAIWELHDTGHLALAVFIAVWWCTWYHFTSSDKHNPFLSALVPGVCLVPNKLHVKWYRYGTSTDFQYPLYTMFVLFFQCHSNQTKAEQADLIFLHVKDLPKVVQTA